MPMGQRPRVRTTCGLWACGTIGGLLLSIAHYPSLAADAEQSLPIKIAVFDFELEDASPAATLLGETNNSATLKKKVSSEARRTLANSGRYRLIDVDKVDAQPALEKSLRNCGGCDAGIALQLGA